MSKNYVTIAKLSSQSVQKNTASTEDFNFQLSVHPDIF